jgi:ABC-type Fe3+-hydroxamate transport system substrate-binding protein
MKQIVIDQMQREVEIVSPLLRIVSLVPSQTELIVDLGLEKHLVGVTKFCVHPKELKNRIQQIGGTKNVDIQKVIDLKPDLVIGNKEENFKSDIDKLEQHVPVWMSDIYTLDDAYEMIQQIGELTDKEVVASDLVNRIKYNFSKISPLIEQKKCLYLIWRKPYMAAGKNTFIDHLLEQLGFENALQIDRYPEVEFTNLEPDYIFLSSEPYPFKEKHIEELQTIFPSAQIRLVDGEFFSWYGSRLLGAPNYFNKLLSYF